MVVTVAAVASCLFIKKQIERINPVTCGNPVIYTVSKPRCRRGRSDLGMIFFAPRSRRRLTLAVIVIAIIVVIIVLDAVATSRSFVRRAIVHGSFVHVFHRLAKAVGRIEIPLLAEQHDTQIVLRGVNVIDIGARHYILTRMG